MITPSHQYGLPDPSKVAILLTTHDRPIALQACLVSIEECIGSVDVPVVVMDDESTNPDTLSMLESLSELDSVHVVRRKQDVASINGGAHRSIQENARAGFEHVVNLGKEFILKIDDDILATPDALEATCQAWRSASEAGAILAGACGMRTVNQDECIDSGEGWSTHQNCAACWMLIPTFHVWNHLLDTQRWQWNAAGWDCAYFDTYVPRWIPGGVFACVNPSAVWHQIGAGTHVNTDWNRPGEFRQRMNGLLQR